MTSWGTKGAWKLKLEALKVTVKVVPEAGGPVLGLQDDVPVFSDYDQRRRKLKGEQNWSLGQRHHWRNGQPPSLFRDVMGSIQSLSQRESIEKLFWQCTKNTKSAKSRKITLNLARDIGRNQTSIVKACDEKVTTDLAIDEMILEANFTDHHVLLLHRGEGQRSSEPRSFPCSSPACRAPETSCPEWRHSPPQRSASVFKSKMRAARFRARNNFLCQHRPCAHHQSPNEFALYTFL